MTRPAPVGAGARLYAALLLACPREFRDHVGDEMVAAFGDRLRTARREGGLGAAAGVWRRALVDLAVTAWRERMAPSRTRARRVGSIPETGGRGMRHQVRQTLQDLRYAVRTLARNPVFTAAAVLTLAVGIGLNAATFSAVHAIVLRDLPGVEEPDDLVQLYRYFSSSIPYGSNSIPHYRDLRDRSGDIYRDVAAWTLIPVSLSADGRNERLTAVLASANFFRTLGAEPILGPGFVPGVDDRTPGEPAVVVLGHTFWRTRFGGDPAVVGRTLRVNGAPYEVVGVAPEGFRGPLSVADAPLYLPLMMQARLMPGTDRMESRGTNFLSVVARLRDDVSMAQARAATDALFESIRADHPESYGDGTGINFVPQSEAGIHPSMRAAQIGMSTVLLVLVGLLLLIACVNVANLFLARARERRREMAIRLSLGAGRGRIVRQLLTESLVFSAVAGLAGLALAGAAVRLMSRVRPPGDGPWSFDFTLDRPVLLFTLAVSVGAGLLFGLWPALRAARAKTVAEVGGRGGRRPRASSALVVAQVALSLVLLVGSGLFLRSLQGAHEIDVGFESGHLLMGRVDPGLQGYGREEAEAFFDGLLGRLRATPGVESAALGEQMPLGFGSQQQGIEVPGYDFGDDERRSFDYNVVGPGYFETMGIPLVRGRGFTEADRTAERLALVVNRRFEEQFWPEEGALGKTVRIGGRDWEVVGVVPTGKYARLSEDPLPFMYALHGPWWNYDMGVLVRATGDPAALAPALRRAVGELDAEMPVTDVLTADSYLGIALMPARLGGQALGLFGAVGLFLAAVGIYGVMAYSVAQRRREMGIRVAVGADRSTVLRQVLVEGMRLTAAGTVLGLALAAVASRAVQGFLYNVSAVDPVAFGVVPLVLVAVAALAVYVPARRAASVDPVVALRIE